MGVTGGEYAYDFPVLIVKTNRGAHLQAGELGEGAATHDHLAQARLKTPAFNDFRVRS